MFGNERNVKDRKREKEYKKRGTRKYGQAKLKHSRMGRHSCVYGLLGILVLAVCIFTAFWMHGKAVGFIGGFGLLSIVLGILGVRAGIKGLREREKNYSTCKIGIVGNTVLLIFLLAIFIGGLK